MVDVSILVSVVSVGIALLSFALNTKRNTEADSKKDTAELTTVIVKLENINDDTKEIKNELKNLKAEVSDLRERTVVVERMYDALHKRIDRIEKQETEV